MSDKILDDLESEPRFSITECLDQIFGVSDDSHDFFIMLDTPSDGFYVDSVNYHMDILIQGLINTYGGDSKNTKTQDVLARHIKKYPDDILYRNLLQKIYNTVSLVTSIHAGNELGAIRVKSANNLEMKRFWLNIYGSERARRDPQTLVQIFTAEEAARILGLNAPEAMILTGYMCACDSEDPEIRAFGKDGLAKFLENLKRKKK